MPLRESSPTAKGSQAPFGEPLLMSPHGPFRTAECSRDVVLVCPALLDEANNGISFGYMISNSILGQDDPGDEDYPMAILGTDQRAIVDDLRSFWWRQGGE